MKMELDASQRCTGKGKRRWAQVAMRENWTWHESKLLHPERGAALEQGPGGWRDPHPWRFPKSDWKGLGQPNRGWEVAQFPAQGCTGDLARAVCT